MITSSEYFSTTHSHTGISAQTISKRIDKFEVVKQEIWFLSHQGPLCSVKGATSVLLVFGKPESEKTEVLELALQASGFLLTSMLNCPTLQQK